MTAPELAWTWLRSLLYPAADTIDTADELELLRMQTRHLARIRGYLRFVVAAIVVLVVVAALWIASVG